MLLKLAENTEWNYSYFPILFSTEKELLLAEQLLLENRIIPRRYFYPTLQHLPYVPQTNLSEALSISQRVLCLPLYAKMDYEIINQVCEQVILSLTKSLTL
jgi:dTDP-4-amino-4,6-dideoxygalactose transaminase